MEVLKEDNWQLSFNNPLEKTWDAVLSYNFGNFYLAMHHGNQSMVVCVLDGRSGSSIYDISGEATTATGMYNRMMAKYLDGRRNSFNSSSPL